MTQVNVEAKDGLARQRAHQELANPPASTTANACLEKCGREPCDCSVHTMVSTCSYPVFNDISSVFENMSRVCIRR